MKYTLARMTGFAVSLTCMALTANAEPALGPTGNYYEVIAYTPGTANSAKTWDAANTEASNRFHLGIRGHLATITSFAEDQFVDQRRRAAGLSAPEAWIGGHQSPHPCSDEPDCNWVWVTGEAALPTENGTTAGYANWLPYQGDVEPNNLNGNEHHLAVGLGNNFGWNDEGALGNIGGFVVEYPGILAEDDGPIDASSGVPKTIDVLDNDKISADVANLEILGLPATVDVNLTDFTVTYTSAADFEGTDSFQYRVTDENSASSIATVTVEVSATESVVEEGTNQLIFNQAKNPSPDSNNPMTAAYQKVLEGGSVTIACCTVLDTREGAGKRGSFLARNFDLGNAVSDLHTNPSCAGMPEIAQGTAILRPWQRGVPKSKGINPVIPEILENTRENDLGVCAIQSGVSAKGVVFSAEEARNVLGYSLDGSIDSIRYRPFTGGVSTDPLEIDEPYVAPWTAEWDESRSGKRFSDNVMVVNLWHEWLLLPSVPYLYQLATALEDSISAVRAEGCVENNEHFLDDMRDLVRRAKFDILVAALPWRRVSSGNAAVQKLNDVTRRALLIGPDSPATDPYLGSCVLNPNPQGLFVGRAMALKFAACSELVHPLSSSSSLDGACMIEEDILCALPELPGFPHPASCTAPD